MKPMVSFNLRSELQNLVVESLPSQAEWDASRLFETLRIASTHFRSKSVSRAWYCQVLADQIQHVGEQFAAGKIDVGRANRYLLMVLQHLEAARPQRSDNPALVLRGLRLDDHVLLGTKISHASFVNCDFRRADLTGSQFRFCAFSACVFDEAELSRVVMVRCEVQGCSFRRASLNQASFRATRTLGSNFDEAMLEGAKGIV